MLVGAAALTGSAHALTVDEVAAQYTDLGYNIEEIRLRLNGTIKIEAVFEGVKVEIIVDAESGAVLRLETDDDEPSAVEDEDHDEDEDSEDEDEDEDEDESHDSGSASGSDDEGEPEKESHESASVPASGDGV